MNPKRVVILGVTGSIGTQAISVIASHPDAFQLVGVSSGGNDLKKFVDECILYSGNALPEELSAIGFARHDAFYEFYKELNNVGIAPPMLDFMPTDLGSGLPVHGHAPGTMGDLEVRKRGGPRIVTGPLAAVEIASMPVDVVLNGITGSVGLAPTLAALRAGNVVALANKESLVAGGPLVQRLARPGQIVPVDSEHSAIAQCLADAKPTSVAKLILTASGGPFRTATLDGMRTATPEQALAHPTWKMGPVVTVNSATMMNKALEVLEAQVLFGVDFDQIEVVVHPQSVVHSMVEFVDGSTIAQLSPPDMRLPIALGLTWPERLEKVAPAVDWTTAHEWTFAPLDHERFPAIRLAIRAGKIGGTMPAVLNASNEEAVAAFLAGRIGFLDIVDTVARVMDLHADSKAFCSSDDMEYEDVLAAETWARRKADMVMNR